MECSMPGFQCKCLYLLSRLSSLWSFNIEIKLKDVGQWKKIVMQYLPPETGNNELTFLEPKEVKEESNY